MKKLAVLVSDTGSGTNLQAILDGISAKKINAEIAVVVSDTPSAQAVERAKKHKVKVEISEHKENLLPILQTYNPDFICLAGWKQFITDSVIDYFPHKILNLHPGLIPDSQKSFAENPDGTQALWNKGKLTDKAIREFLNNKATYAGSSIHFLTHEFDFGPVVGRCFEKVKQNDTIESLYKRLKKKENALYVSVLKKLCMEAKKKKNIVAIIDSGGRGAALAQAYSKSQNVSKIIAIPGNDLYQLNSRKKVLVFPNLLTTSISEIISICKKEKVDLVDVAQDDAVAAGLVDSLQKEGFKTVGPTKAAGQIEWDKAWARDFMKKYKIPSPSYQVFNSEKNAVLFIKKNQKKKFFIKAAGLAAGKGAIPGGTVEESIDAISQMKTFGNAGERFVIEEWLTGEEFSFFAVADGKTYQIVGSAQDHKRLLDGDLGQNTGGVGCVTPPKVVSKDVYKQAEEIIKKTIFGLQKEGRPYNGVLYLGAILVNKKVYVIEFNARWGDPEAEVLVPGIQNDFFEVSQNIALKNLQKTKIKTDGLYRVVVTGNLRSGIENRTREIYGVPEVLKMRHITLYPTRLTKKGNKYFVTSGRLFHIVATGKNILEARSHAYAAMSQLFIEGNNLHFRTDIGWRDVERTYV